MFILEIQDNGTGFDPDHVPADRYGLVSIRERAQLFGGGATIESDAQQRHANHREAGDRPSAGGSRRSVT